MHPGNVICHKLKFPENNHLMIYTLKNEVQK